MRVHRFAFATVVATYVLLIVGGLVHATGSSLACPDWPLCHGTLMPRMEHGVEYEHTHRLVAGAVALLTIALSIVLVRDPTRRALRPLAVAAPIMVLAQAVLGGLTVLLRLPRAITLSHLTLSMCFFSVLVVLALRTHARLGAPGIPGPPRARTATGLAALAVLVQVTVGGLVRHSMAGLACTTFPLCFGEAWPPDSSAERIHMAHRYGFVVVAILVIAATVWVLRSGITRREVRLLAYAAPALLLVQATLGVLSVTSLLHRPTVIAHLGVAALLLAVEVAMWTLLGSPAVVAAKRLSERDAAPDATGVLA